MITVNFSCPSHTSRETWTSPNAWHSEKRPPTVLSTCLRRRQTNSGNHDNYYSGNHGNNPLLSCQHVSNKQMVEETNMSQTQTDMCTDKHSQTARAVTMATKHRQPHSGNHGNSVAQSPWQQCSPVTMATV